MPPKRPRSSRRVRTERAKIRVDIGVIGVRGLYVAATQIAGVTLTGPACDDEITAIQSLFWQMGPNAQLINTPMALALALEGATLDDLADDIHALDEGDDG